MHLRTEDHSLVQQLLHAGLYEENDPRRLPNRNVWPAPSVPKARCRPASAPPPWPWSPAMSSCCARTALGRHARVGMEQLLAASQRPDEWIQRMVGRVVSSGNPHQDNLSALTVWICPRDTND
jgi:hypothetical protein